MKIVTIEVTVIDTNCRLVIDEKSKLGAIIDPGGDVDLIVKTIKNEGVYVDTILLTHSHFDHCGGVRGLVDHLIKLQGEAPRFMCHREEQMMREHVKDQVKMFGIVGSDAENCPEPDRYLNDDESFMVGAVSFQALHTPGHSPGHLSFYSAEPEPTVFSGDALFRGGIGRTDLIGGDYNLLMDSIRGKLFILPDNCAVLPGHGADTTIAIEKKTNPFMNLKTAV